MVSEDGEEGVTMGTWVAGLEVVPLVTATEAPVTLGAETSTVINGLHAVEAWSTTSTPVTHTRSCAPWAMEGSYNTEAVALAKGCRSRGGPTTAPLEFTSVAE
jgi:hypothetical protein